MSLAHQKQPVSDFPTMLGQARAGCAEVKGRLLSLYADYLDGHARAFLSHETIERASPADFVQETLLKAHRDFNEFHGSSEGEFRAWLRTILHNTICDHLQGLKCQKRDARREVPLDLDLSDSLARYFFSATPSGLEELLRQEAAVLIRKHMSHLCETSRAVLYMRAVEELNFREIGLALEISAGAARQTFQRAVATLRELLEEDGLRSDG
jgi:RNA polymerase sigma-70 factor (ECF subfamily)